DDNSTKHSTCQSNDSEGSFGNPFEHSSEFESESISVPNEMSVSKPNVNTGRVNVNSVRHNVNSVRTNVNTGRSKQPVPTCNSNSFSPVRPQVNKEIEALLLIPQQVIIGGDQDQTPIIIVDPILLELSSTQEHGGQRKMNIHNRTKTKPKNTKTEPDGKFVKDKKRKSRAKSQSCQKVIRKVNPDKVKVKVKRKSKQRKYNLRDCNCQSPKLYYKNIKDKG
ncbi:hypothetical protein Tco_0443055, partial [Tanacetum coccineum]